MKIGVRERVGVVSVGVLVVLVLIVGGSVGATAATDTETVTSETVVTDDGSIESIETIVGVDEAGYEVLEANARQAGYEDVTAWYESLYSDEPWIGTVSVTVEEIDGGYQLELEFDDIDTDDVDRLAVTADGDTVSYEEYDVVQPATGPQYSTIEHRVVMPGPITETNADAVEGNVATWTADGELSDELYAVSGGDGEPLEDESVDDSDGVHSTGVGERDSEGSANGERTDGIADRLSGFGGAVAVVSLCLAIGIREWRHESDG